MAKHTPDRCDFRRVGSLLFAPVVLAALLLAAVPAHAQQGWGTPVALGTGLPGWAPAVAVDQAGNVFVAWRVETGADSWIRVRRYSAADATWSVPADLSTPAARPSGNASPIAAVDAAGNAVVIWRQDGIFASRYSATTGSWGAPIVITPAPASADCWVWETIRMAVDPVGRVFVVWVQPCRDPGQFGRYTHTVHAARYAPVTGVVAEATLSDEGTGSSIDADVAVDPLGNATVMWPQWSQPGAVPVVMQAASYTVTTGTWSAPATVLPSPYDGSLSGVRVASDALGHLIAVWQLGDTRDFSVIRTARYDAVSRAWSHIADLGAVTPPRFVTHTHVAVDPAGNAVAVWEEIEPVVGLVPMRVRGARYDARTGAWDPALDLSAPSPVPPNASIATDALGNLTAVWSERGGASPSSHTIRGARLTSSGDRTVTDLAVGDLSGGAIGVGAGGHAAVVWMRGYNAPAEVEVLTWRATPAAPGIASVWPGSGTLTVTVAPPDTHEPAFAPIYYDYSTDDGVTWTTRMPASTVSPVRIGGLANGVAYAVRVRAVNIAGPGAASPPVVGTPVDAPTAPTGLMVARQVGRRVTLQWRPPAAGVPVTGYVVHGGGEAGEVEAGLPVASGLPTLTFDAPPGAYYVRVHALAGAAWSPPSNEIRIYADVPLRPSAPRNLRRVVDGSSVALSWENTFELGAPTGVVLEVVRAGSSSIVPLPVVETFRVDGVPAGRYEVYVRTVNAVGESGFGSGSGITFDVPASCGDAAQGPPHVPTDLVAVSSGLNYHVAWAPPADGPAVESYVVQVDGSYTDTTTTTSRVLSGLAPPGVYAVSVAGRNSCGTGPATAPATVLVP
ncbi:MAG: hypothetical protein AB7Q16_09760 [Vicinamibacterales bacterium]